MQIYVSHCVSKKGQCCRRGNYMTVWYHQRTQSIHMTDGVTVTSLSASLPQKLSVATDCLLQISLSQKLSHKFEKWCQFSSSVKAKSCKKKLHFTWQLASLFNDSVLHECRLCSTCCYSTLPWVWGSYISVRSTTVLGTIFKKSPYVFL